LTDKNKLAGEHPEAKEGASKYLRCVKGLGDTSMMLSLWSKINDINHPVIPSLLEGNK